MLRKLIFSILTSGILCSFSVGATATEDNSDSNSEFDPMKAGQLLAVCKGPDDAEFKIFLEQLWDDNSSQENLSEIVVEFTNSFDRTFRYQSKPIVATDDFIHFNFKTYTFVPGSGLNVPLKLSGKIVRDRKNSYIDRDSFLLDFGHETSEEAKDTGKEITDIFFDNFSCSFTDFIL